MNLHLPHRPAPAPDPLESQARALLAHRRGCGTCAFCVGEAPTADEATTATTALLPHH